MDHTEQNAAMEAHTESTYQVWVATPAGQPAYAYRTDLIYSVARRWTEAWNKDVPADVAPGSQFVAVEAVTTYRVLRGY
jgi:hypothetical protein